MKKIKEILGKLLKIKDAPEKVALGFAIGVFFAIVPTFYVGVILAVGIAFIVKVNKFAALIGSLIGTIPIFPPISMTLSAIIGAIFTGENWKKIINEIPESNYNISYLIKEFAYTFIIGNLIFAVIVSLLSYFLIKFFLKNLHRKNV
jgi:uncharacterized protein (DUF2062 family)